MLVLGKNGKNDTLHDHNRHRLTAVKLKPILLRVYTLRVTGHLPRVVSAGGRAAISKAAKKQWAKVKKQERKAVS